MQKGIACSAGRRNIHYHWLQSEFEGRLEANERYLISLLAKKYSDITNYQLLLEALIEDSRTIEESIWDE